MRMRSLHGVLLVLLGLLATTARAADLGALVGLITDAHGAPVAHATVTALQQGGGAVRATLSGSDCVYSFADLPAGNWSVSVEVPGGPGASAAALVVVAGKA